jgi:uncharacterized Ntn-hydrolase superfamily protein
MTFSIVACDPSGDCGVAVASRFLAVGSVVPFVRAGVGAIATQALANVAYGPDGLALLAAGTPAQGTLDRLVGADTGARERQVGIVDGRGGSATFTGSDCVAWAGGHRSEGVTIQGNILAGPSVVDAMLEAWTGAAGTGFADRLLAALAAGDTAGGDRRGRQSAALVVSRPGGGYLGADDRWLDLRVDDHPDPIPELGRLRRLHRLLWERPAPEDLVPLTSELAGELRRRLAVRGGPPSAAGGTDLAGPTGAADGPGAIVPIGEPRPLPEGWDASSQARLVGWMEQENLEMRVAAAGWIDPMVVEHLRSTSPGRGARLSPAAGRRSPPGPP